MKIRMNPWFCFTVAALMMSSCSSADKMGGSSEPISPMKVNDEMALNQLHHINQKEISLAQMALEKAQSPNVKSHAQAIVNDHQALDAQVQASAKEQGFKLQAFMPSTYDKSVMENMAKLEGSQFDQAFMSQMRQSHQLALNDLRMIRNNVGSASVTSLIDQAMPRIEQHNQMFQMAE